MKVKDKGIYLAIKIYNKNKGYKQNPEEERAYTFSFLGLGLLK